MRSLQVATIAQYTTSKPEITDQQEDAGVKLPALAVFLALLSLRLLIPKSLIAVIN